jgi:colanic acid/amylovoran biosynthesis glycosyltransferase
MKKIAYFVNQHLPLSEVFVSDQAQVLTDNTDYQVEIIGCRQTSPSVKHHFPTTLINQNHTFQEKIDEAVFKIAGFSPKLEREFSRFDLVHAHFGTTGWLATPIARRTKKPLIVTLHGFDVLRKIVSVKNDGLLHVLYKNNLSRLTHYADKFICVSEHLKKHAMNMGFPQEKCIVNYMGIPLRPHSIPKSIWNKQQEPFRILAVGRLVPVKGHEYLIKAVSNVQKQGYSVRLDIIGAGPLKESLEKQAAETLDHFQFHGALSHQETLNMMRQSHLFAHTSTTTQYGQTEAFGLVISEAQWCGLPVVAFKSGGIPEAIDEGNTGLLSPENDVDALSKTIKMIIDNDELRNKMERQAPEFIQRHFDSHEQIKKLSRIYETVLSK